MKFHHLGQHLLDTNCLLLILKMFGLQEVTNSVVSKVDSPENKLRFPSCSWFAKNFIACALVVFSVTVS